MYSLIISTCTPLGLAQKQSETQLRRWTKSNCLCLLVEYHSPDAKKRPGKHAIHLDFVASRDIFLQRVGTSIIIDALDNGTINWDCTLWWGRKSVVYSIQWDQDRSEWSGKDQSESWDNSQVFLDSQSSVEPDLRGSSRINALGISLFSLTQDRTTITRWILPLANFAVMRYCSHDLNSLGTH